jgi:predicted lipid-binding transport protein (Tim44 family)
MRKMSRLLSGVVILTVLAIVVPDEVWARAGGGFSSGSRGSRSYSSPSRTYSAPAPSPSTRPTPAPAPAPLAQPAPAGGFLRSMAGGIVGGLLGGMLFRSLGFAGGMGEGAGGGFGMMDFLLLAGIAYLIYWFVRRKRAAQEAPATAYSSQMAADAYGSGAPTAVLDAPTWQQDRDRGLGHVRQLDAGFDEAAFRELCTDRFFQIQAAWMRRDVDKLRPLLTAEMQGVFGKQIEIAKTKRQSNKLENITVRSVELTEVWQESGQDYMTVRLLANLLDYTVDDTTGQIVDGSDRAPVKFEEFWTWTRSVGTTDWRLSAINQAE